MFAQNSAADLMKAEAIAISRIENVKRICGQICDTSKEGHPLEEISKIKEFQMIKKTVDCKVLFENTDILDSNDFEVSDEITGEIESCDFEPPDGATLETLDKHWQNY